MQATAAVSWTGWEDLEPFVRDYVDKRCFDRSAVDDVVQETLMRVASRRARFGPPHSPRGWAVRIAQNLMRDRVRTLLRERTACSGEPELDSLPASVCEPGERLEGALYSIGGVELDHSAAWRELERALAAVSTDDRNLIATFYAGRHGAARVVEQCDVPAQRVKLRLFRARRRVRQLLLRQLARRRDELASRGVAAC